MIEFESNIFEGQPDHSFRTEIPNIIFDLELTPHEFKLYCYYKRVAGDRGNCYKSRGTIEKECGISAAQQKRINAKLKQPFEKLGGAPLILCRQTEKEDGSPGTTQIFIVDIWRCNGDYFRNENKDYVGSHRAGGSAHTERRVGSDRAEGGLRVSGKEDPLEEDPFKNSRTTNVVLDGQARKARKPSSRKPPDKLTFSFKSWQFQGIEDADLEAWKVAYPDVDLRREITKAQEWLKAEPSRAKRKKAWRRFLTGWIGRTQSKIDEQAARNSQRGHSIQTAAQKSDAYKHRPAPKDQGGEDDFFA